MSPAAAQRKAHAPPPIQTYRHRSVALDKLTPYTQNAHTHSEAQVAQVQAAMTEFGFTNPVLIDEDGGIIAGHCRVMAAAGLGMVKVPCVVLAGLTEDQRKAYIIADNKLALNAGWDMEMLAAEVQSLQDSDFSLSLLAFTDEELADLLGEVPEGELPDLGGEDKEPFNTMTFTLHDEQKQAVDDALMRARAHAEIDTGLNENTNGNAITFICEHYLRAVS